MTHTLLAIPCLRPEGSGNSEKLLASMKITIRGGGATMLDDRALESLSKRFTVSWEKDETE
jgi:hypothetical protein